MTSTIGRPLGGRLDSVRRAGGTIEQQVLTRARSGREVIQELVPLAQSLEWILGQQYLRERGNKAFVSDTSPIPYVVNNDGRLSRQAAEVLYANLEAGAQEQGDIYVLELGIGVGLFARYFLDHFREICQKRGRDYYDRLCYVAADRSTRMLLDVARHGVLAAHPGRFRLRQVDAMSPGDALPYDYCFHRPRGSSEPDEVSRTDLTIRPTGEGPDAIPDGVQPARPFRAVFLNYLLDCLPAAVLEVGPDNEEPRQLYVRTCLARNVNLADVTDMSLAQLQQRARSDDPRAQQELLEVYGCFAAEYDYRPLAAREREGGIPNLDFALHFARNNGNRVLHSYGAIQSLEQLLELVTDDGFILINDYGPAEIKQEDDFEHQRFSLATFVGVNFPLLAEYFGGEKKLQWEQPDAEAGGIHSRLLARNTGSETVTCFERLFGKAEYDRLHQPLDKARECAKVGRFEQAAALYQQTMERQPHNWVLLNELAQFLTFSLRDPKAGADMAKLALDLNPACSSDLWCTLGDALYEWGRTAEAGSAYLRALDINDSDVRARFNLSFVYFRQKKHGPALDTIAQALTLDKTGAYRERLLQKQQEILAHLTARNQQEFLRMVNLVSKPAVDDKK